jgi:phosphopentomutase
VATGRLIVYTSEDSVFQIAAHEDVVPVEVLYDYCRAARAILTPPHGVGRVIARPFLGSSTGYYRTPRRKDFSIEPPGDTVLDLIARAGRRVLTIGKIDDLFAGRGIAEAVHTADNRDGMHRTLDAVRSGNFDFVFVNLVDFDTMWGHRNDARAYALGLEDFDSFLVDFLPALGEDDLLLITSDHGNDPTTPGTDHSREDVPLVVYHPGMKEGRSLGVRDTFADVGATVAQALGCTAPVAGTSFLGAVI